MNYDHACVIWTPEDEDIAAPSQVIAAPSQGKSENSGYGHKVHSNQEQSEIPR